MPLRQFPTFTAGNQYVVDGDLLNQILAAIEQDGKLAVAPPLFVQDGPGGKTICIALPSGAVLLRLTGTATGAGTYTARTQKVTTNTQSSSTDLSLATWYGDLQTSDDAIYENLFENKLAAGVHLLGTGANAFVIARLTGRFASDRSNLPIYEGDSAPDGMIPVQVKKTSGVAGSMATSTSCTWVYSLYDLSGNAITGATGLTPDVTRYANCKYDTPADNSPGIAYFDASGTIHLYSVAQEKPTGATINVVTTPTFNSGSGGWGYKTTPALVLDKGTEGSETIYVSGSGCP